MDHQLAADQQIAPAETFVGAFGAISGREQGDPRPWPTPGPHCQLPVEVAEMVGDGNIGQHLEGAPIEGPDRCEPLKPATGRSRPPGERTKTPGGAVTGGSSGT